MDTKIRDSYEVIVIGSGPSGSAFARQLALAGVRCLVLLFLRVSRLLPRFALRALLKATALDRFLPAVAAWRLRKLEMGLRGLVFSLYYSFLDTPSGSGRRIQEAIGWDAAVRTKPEDPDDLPGLVRRASPIEGPEANHGDPCHALKPAL